MLSYRKENNRFIDIFLAYQWDPMKDVGLVIRYDKKDRDICVNGDIPDWVSHMVDIEELKKFANNILELAKKIKNKSL